eukprot:scaffold124649_cov22-Prasinocladus_malaysianus.AAC.1
MELARTCVAHQAACTIVDYLTVWYVIPVAENLWLASGGHTTPNFCFRKAAELSDNQSIGDRQPRQGPFMPAMGEGLADQRAAPADGDLPTVNYYQEGLHQPECLSDLQGARDSHLIARVTARHARSNCSDMEVNAQDNIGLSNKQAAKSSCYASSEGFDILISRRVVTCAIMIKHSQKY